MNWYFLYQSQRALNDIYDKSSNGYSGDALTGLLTLGVIIYASFYLFKISSPFIYRVYKRLAKFYSKCRKLYFDCREYLLGFSYIRRKVFARKADEALGEILEIGRKYQGRGEQDQLTAIMRSVSLLLLEYDKRCYPYLLRCVDDKKENLDWMLCCMNEEVLKYGAVYRFVLSSAESHIESYRDIKPHLDWNSS